eukprot:COSAG01_NODE_51465_length_354_cov_1.835294_1_plen_45_part_10
MERSYSPEPRRCPTLAAGRRERQRVCVCVCGDESEAALTRSQMQA